MFGYDRPEWREFTRCIEKKKPAETASPKATALWNDAANGVRSGDVKGNHGLNLPPEMMPNLLELLDEGQAEEKKEKEKDSTRGEWA